MKFKQIIPIAFIMAFSLNGTAQIKIFTGGTTVLGDLSLTGSGSKLTVVGNSTFLDANTTITSAALIRGNHAFSSATTPDYSWWGNDRTGIFHPAADNIGFTINGSEKARINNAGHWLFNTTTDYGWLNIKNTDGLGSYIEIYHNNDWWATTRTETNRSLSVNHLLTLSGGTSFYVAGAGWIYSQGNYLGSDKNIKDEITTIDSASAKINKLRGVTYKLKKEKANPAVYGRANEYMGVIAQEVEAVAPQVVKTFGDNTKGVCYEMLVGLLIQGMKEQNAKIAQLESDLNGCCTAKGNGRMAGDASSSSATPGNSSSNSITGGSYVKQNVPNPFNKETIIDYYIAEKSLDAGILVFDMNGKLLRTLKLSARGNGSVSISAGDLQPGMYYYSLMVDGREIDTKKMIITE